jgi:hypothetical protein
MKQIIRDSSGYYLLGYNSTQAPTDGKFHEIKVRVTRRGVDVRARKGYWAFTAEEAARASAPPKPGAPPAVAAALNAIAEPERGRPARFWIGTSRGENGQTRVTFTWEPITPPAGAPAEPGGQAARILITATTSDGRGLFKGRAPEETAPAPAGAPAAAGGTIAFEAPPGQVQLRLVVEGAKGQVIDSVTRELTLPDFSRVQVGLATPRVYRGRTVRDLANIKANPSAPPTADREFSRTDRLLVRTDAYTPGSVVPAMTARLLNRGGTRMADLPVQAQGSAGEIELPLASLPVGDYLIELNAKTEAGTAQELIAFKVGR